MQNDKIIVTKQFMDDFMLVSAHYLCTPDEITVMKQLVREKTPDAISCYRALAAEIQPDFTGMASGINERIQSAINLEKSSKSDNTVSM